MSRRLAVIDGNKTIGNIHVTMEKRRSDHVVTLPTQGKPPVVIKLPREHLDRCGRECRRSGAFSYHEDIAGRSAIIYATDDQKRLYAAFIGIVDRVSQKTQRAFALKDAKRLEREELPLEIRNRLQE